MKFFLIVYICSSISGDCVIPPGYPKEQSGYYDCVRNGLSESYEVLYQGELPRDAVVNNKLYPKFACDEFVMPKPKPKLEVKPDQPASLSTGTILRGIFRLVTYSIN